MRSVILLIICTVAFTLGTCKPERPVGLSETMSDSLEYYFQRANDDSLATPVRKRFTERALMITETMPKDSVYVKNLFRVANRYWNMGNKISYKHYSYKILKISKQSDDRIAMAKASKYIADYWNTTPQYDSILFYLKKAETYYRQVKDYDGEADTLLEIGQFLLFMNANYSAETAALKALAIIKNANSKKVLNAEAHSLLGNIYYEFKDYDLAEYHYKISLLDKDSYPSHFYGSHLNLGVIKMKRKKFVEAIESFKITDRFFKSRGRCPNYATVIHNTGYCYFKLGKLKKGLNLMKKSLEIRDSLNFIPGIIESKINLCEFYKTTQDTISAVKEARELLEITIHNKMPLDRLRALNELIVLEKNNKNKNYQAYKNLSDSLQLAERRLHNKFARIEYETEELKQQNASLLTNNQKLSVGGSVIALALASGLLLRHYRAKKKELTYALNQQKANDEIYHLLQQQQQKVEEGRRLEKHRISQELHDGVMGKLSGIRLNLFILNKRTDPEAIAHCIQNINKIQEVEKEIRTIAYDLDNTLFEDDRSFATLLHGIVESIESHSETRFQLLLDPSIDWNDIPNTRKMQLYRVLQEALTNIDKYACAAHGVVSIKGWGSKLSVIVSDDGIGFSPSHTRSGLGLKNMESRIRNEGGSFKLKSIHGRGTRILFTLPFTT